MKLKSVCTEKETVNKEKKQSHNGRKIVASYTSALIRFMST